MSFSTLAELCVLARCLSVEESVVSTLLASRPLSEMVMDLIRLQPHLTMSQALTLTKSMLKEKVSRPSKDEEKQAVT